MAPPSNPPSSEPAGAPREVAIGAFALVALATLAWCWRPLWGVDVFWHVAVGRVIAEGGLPQTDVFSAADPAAPWVTFQWLYEFVVAAIDRAWGLTGLRALHAGVIALAAGGWAALWTRRAGPLAGLVAAATLLLLFEDRVRARPHVFEMAFCLLLVAATTGPPRRLVPWALAGVAALWANLHAVSSLWWLALMGAWAVGRWDRRAGGPWLLGLVCIATAPGALAGLNHALTSHSDWPAEFVPELRGTLAYAGEGLWGAVVLAGVAAGLLAALDLARRRAPLGEILTAAGCALAAALLARWAWFAAVPLALWWARARPRRAVGVALIAVCVLALGFRVGGRWTLQDRGSNLEPGRWPVAACDFMDEVGLRGPTDTSGAWSGYVLYRLHPGARVLADGRLVFGADVADLLRRRGNGDVTTFDEAVGRFRLHALLWPAGGVPPRDAGRWWRVYEDDVAEVWVPSPRWTDELVAAVAAERARRGLPPTAPGGR